MEVCPACHAEADDHLDRCLACYADLAPPNIRTAGSAAERDALSARVSDARTTARSRGHEQVLESFVAAMRSTRVVVAMPATMLFQLLHEPRSVFANYEALVGAQLRRSADGDSDEIRRAVGASLFGSYADKIRYGCLSVDGRGLHNYGDYACVLGDEMVSRRVSFLEENSYSIMRQANVFEAATTLRGRRSVWSNRDELCTAKHAQDVAPSQTEDDWGRMLVGVGANRDLDRFVEAHIYGPFNAHSIVEIARLRVDRPKAIDKLIDELWSERGQRPR